MKLIPYIFWCHIWMLSEFLFSNCTRNIEWNIFLLRNPDYSVSKVTQVIFMRGVGILSLPPYLHHFWGKSWCMSYVKLYFETLFYPQVTYRRWKNILPGNFHSRTVHLDIIKVFTPTDAQILKSSIKIYIKTAPTCYGVITIVMFDLAKVTFVKTVN
jgi:hypothetical protein